MSKKLMLSGITSLVLFGWQAPEAIAAPTDDPCKGKKTERPDSCGAEQTPGGEHRSLRITFDSDKDIKGDDTGLVYSDSEKTVEAQLGGQAQPNKPGFKLGLKKLGQRYREITADVTCQGLPGGLNNCTQLPSNGVLLVTDDTMSLGLRPYEVNCPEGQPDHACPDVFTMGTGVGAAELMGFGVNFWNQGIFIEIASVIGGEGSLNPGRCLSLLSEPERTAYLSTQCSDAANCNVNVVAFDDGDLSGAGTGDGENDEWHVDAVDVWALMCNLGSGYEKVYGMTRLNFGTVAIKE